MHRVIPTKTEVTVRDREPQDREHKDREHKDPEEQAVRRIRTEHRTVRTDRIVRDLQEITRINRVEEPFRPAARTDRNKNLEKKRLALFFSM